MGANFTPEEWSRLSPQTQRELQQKGYKPESSASNQVAYTNNGYYGTTAKSSAGMPSNVQRGSSQNITRQATAPTGMPTSAKQAQAAQQNKEAISKAHSDANYNAAVAAKEAAKKNVPPVSPTPTNTNAGAGNASTGNASTSNASTSNASTGNTGAGNKTSKSAVSNTPATSTAPSAPAAPAQNNYNLEQYDKYAADNLKKTLAKAGKLDQYQNFVNDFYGSSSMDNNRYDELMNKYGLGDTLKNNFYFGRANAADSFGYAGKNKTKQEAKQKAKAPNMEDVLKNASQYDMMQFMVGQGPIYEALKASSKY